MDSSKLSQLMITPEGLLARARNDKQHSEMENARKVLESYKAKKVANKNYSKRYAMISFS